MSLLGDQLRELKAFKYYSSVFTYMVVLFVVIDFQNVDSKVWLLNLRTKWMTALFLKAEVKKVWRIL